MDWELAIRRNREDLLKIVAMIFMTIGLMPGAVVATLPKRVYYAAQRILRPAESAVRRVIFMGMRGLTVPEYQPRPSTAAKPKLKPKLRDTADRVPAFPLIDIRKTFDEPPVSDATGSWASIRSPRTTSPSPRKTCFAGSTLCATRWTICQVGPNAWPA